MYHNKFRVAVHNKKGYSFVDFRGGLGGGVLPEVKDARFITKAIIAAIIRGLRAGKSPKEIAALTGETPHNIRILIYRYREVHHEFVKTYSLRNPHLDGPPPKMANSLREV